MRVAFQGTVYDGLLTRVKHYIEAGVPPHVVMAWSGHRTHSMLARYNVIALDDLRRAGKQASAYQGQKENVIAADFGRKGTERVQSANSKGPAQSRARRS